MRFLDTKRENADEKIRIKTLSLGVVDPGHHVRAREERTRTCTCSRRTTSSASTACRSRDISVTEKYREMVDDARIKKTKIKAREFFQTLAEIQFESGYPYIMFEDTVNRANPIKGRINMSNLCSEILQVITPTTYNEDLSYDQIGKDISCNLGSLNIALAMDSPRLRQDRRDGHPRRSPPSATRATSPRCRSIEDGNDESHAIGLGQMNLHGYLARERVFYGSEEGIDFTNIYFYTVLFHALRASNRIAIERGAGLRRLRGLEVRVGRVLRQVHRAGVGAARPRRSRQLFAEADIHIPTQEDWGELKASVQEHGIYNQNLQAVPPTGSISYINNSTSLDPPDRVEDRDPQGRQARPRLLPGAVHDERQPGVLPGRVRDRLREGHRHLRRGHAARGPGPVADAVLQGHRHHARHQQGADLRVAQGHQDASTTSVCARWRCEGPRWKVASAACCCRGLLTADISWSPNFRPEA